MPSLSRPCIAAVLLLSLALAAPRAAAQTVPTADATTPLRLPAGLAFDTSGDLIVAERIGHTVRRLSPAGVLVILAGTGIQGFSGDGGPATAATLDTPTSLAIDLQGNLFIADTGNHRIRRVDAVSGLITTVAGTGRPAFSGDGGPAAAAALRSPGGLALDAAGNLLIAYTGNHRIRRLDVLTRVITTVAGTGSEGLAGDGGPATAAALDTPTALAIDPLGNLLIADTGNHRVRRLIATTGQLTTLIGSAAMPLHTPTALTLDTGGGVLIAESALHRVLRFDPATGSLTVVAGSGTQAFTGDGAGASAAALDSPAGLALAPDTSILVADSGNGRLRRIASSALGPALIQTVAGPGALLSPVLHLAGASVSSYGAGSLIASFANPAGTPTSATPAPQGTVTLLDLAAATGPTPVSSAALTGGYASLSTAPLAAGTHHLLAAFTGDSTHGPADSSPWTLTVQPLPVTATPASAAILFGESPPPLTGALTGVLPADAARLTAVFTTSASASTPPGTYPIAATLTGLAAPNYALALAPATLLISKAPTLTAIDAPGPSPASLVLHVTSTTSGTPSGTLALLEAGIPLGTGPLDATGRLSLPLQSLTPGPHLLTAHYTGDASFLASQSAPLSLSISATPPATQPDFTLQPASPVPVTVLAGAAASIAFSLTTSNGPMPGPIALSVSGTPAFATATFDPPALVPGATTFKLTVTTASTAARLHPPRPSWQPLLCLTLLPLAWLRRGPRRLASLAVLLAALSLSGCGNRVVQGTTATAPAPTRYTLTVTGTTTTLAGTLLQHSVPIQLSVQP